MSTRVFLVMLVAWLVSSPLFSAAVLAAEIVKGGSD